MSSCIQGAGGGSVLRCPLLLHETCSSLFPSVVGNRHVIGKTCQVGRNWSRLNKGEKQWKNPRNSKKTLTMEHNVFSFVVSVIF